MIQVQESHKALLYSHRVATRCNMMSASGSKEEAIVKYPSKAESCAEHLALLALGSLLLGFCAVVLGSQSAADIIAFNRASTYLFV